MIKEAVNILERKWDQISGAPYDGEQIGKPEREYIHDYTKTLLMKIFVSEPSATAGISNVSMNFEQILQLIKELDELTRQIPKILYLVGWQYNGHDDKYPAFFEVNPLLKRACDRDARESLIWLMEEAFQYHTTVSLHINMTDAYEDSPLWETYTSNDLIAKKDNGELFNIGEWGHFIKKTAYQVNYSKEWESGYAKKRIDRLLDYLPIKRAGTIHCDAFFARASLDTSLDSEKEAKRKIIRYFRDCGVDLTTEFLHGTNGDRAETYTDGNDSGVLGLIPCIWHFNQSQEDYMKRPASLITGAGINKDLLYGDDEGIDFLFGKSMYGEDTFFNQKDRYGLNPDWEREFKKQFCQQTLLWAYQNQVARKELKGQGDQRILYYEDGLVADLNRKLIQHKEVILREDNDVFVPVIWKNKQEIIAYSLHGYTDKLWHLPSEFNLANEVLISDISSNGLVKRRSQRIINHCVQLSLEPEQMIVIQPVIH